MSPTVSSITIEPIKVITGAVVSAAASSITICGHWYNEYSAPSEIKVNVLRYSIEYSVHPLESFISVPFWNVSSLNPTMLNNSDSSHIEDAGPEPSPGAGINFVTSILE